MSGINKLDKLKLLKLHFESLGYYCNTNERLHQFVGDHYRVYRSWWSWVCSLFCEGMPMAVITNYVEYGDYGVVKEVDKGAKVQVSCYAFWRSAYSNPDKFSKYQLSRLTNGDCVIRNVVRGVKKQFCCRMFDLHHPDSTGKVGEFVRKLFCGGLVWKDS